MPSNPLVMPICPSCGQENPDGFRLCGMCGASLALEEAAAREERKVVRREEERFDAVLVGGLPKLEELLAGLAPGAVVPGDEVFKLYDSLGVPFDFATNRPGSRFGPAQIREMSRLVRRFNSIGGPSPFDQCTVADLGDARVERDALGVRQRVGPSCSNNDRQNSGHWVYRSMTLMSCRSTHPRCEMSCSLIVLIPIPMSWLMQAQT